jgi:hypothetical protein
LSGPGTCTELWVCDSVDRIKVAQYVEQWWALLHLLSWQYLDQLRNSAPLQGSKGTPFIAPLYLLTRAIINITVVQKCVWCVVCMMCACAVSVGKPQG